MLLNPYELIERSEKSCAYRLQGGAVQKIFFDENLSVPDLSFVSYPFDAVIRDCFENTDSYLILPSFYPDDDGTKVWKWITKFFLLEETRTKTLKKPAKPDFVIERDSEFKLEGKLDQKKIEKYESWLKQQEKYVSQKIKDALNNFVSSLEEKKVMIDYEGVRSKGLFLRPFSLSHHSAFLQGNFEAVRFLFEESLLRKGYGRDDLLKMYTEQYRHPISLIRDRDQEKVSEIIIPEVIDDDRICKILTYRGCHTLSRMLKES